MGWVRSFWVVWVGLYGWGWVMFLFAGRIRDEFLDSCFFGLVFFFMM